MLPLVTYSLRKPLEGLTFLQLLLWPLIFAQLVALKRRVRAKYGRGVPYRLTISPFGAVRLARMPMDAAFSYAAPGPLAPISFDFTTHIVRAAFRSACTPDAAPRAPAPARIIRIGMDFGLSEACDFNTS